MTTTPPGHTANRTAAPPSPDDFEQKLNQCLDSHDLPGIRQLVTDTAPFIADDSYLAQWHQYAQGYLAGQDGQRLDEAIRLFESLRSQADLAPKLRGCVLNALGIVYEMREQWDRALHCYHECAAEDEAQKSYMNLGITLHNLAIVYSKVQDYTAAIECAQRSIHTFRPRSQETKWLSNVGVALNTLGFAFLRQGQMAEARTALAEALQICRSCQDHFTEGIVYNNLGQVCRKLGQAEQAADYYQRAYTLTLATENQREAAEAAYGLGLLNLHTATLPQASANYFAKALELAQATHNHEIITDILLSQADLYEQTGDLPHALATNQSAVQTVESLRANIMLPDDRARLTATRTAAYEQMVRRLLLAPKTSNYAQAFHYTEMAKARTLIEMLGARALRLPSEIPPDWLVQELTLRQTLQSLYGDGHVQSEQIAALENNLHHLRERLRVQHAEFESFQAVHPLQLEEVQARLPPGSVLLEYFTIGDEIQAFVVTPTEVYCRPLPLRVPDLRRAFKLIGEDRLGPLHNLTRGETHTLRQPWILQNLHQRLIEPLGPTVAQAQLLCVVPHGLLHYVPFHALYQQTATGPRYLSESVAGEARPILYAPSATVLLDYCQHKPLATGNGCLAVGYNHQALQHAEAEAVAVAQQLNGTAYTGANATRAALLQTARNYRYVHLSCHGWFNPAWPLSSGIALADHALDVADVLRELQLNAELVCLSACETGRSQIRRGDELVGLARAFLYAGAPAVLVSHWVVDEFSTRLLLERFYQELLRLPDGVPARTALALSRAQRYLRQMTRDELQARIDHYIPTAGDAQQQLDFLRSTAPSSQSNHLLDHPYYWASFFLVGDRLTTFLESRRFQKCW